MENLSFIIQFSSAQQVFDHKQNKEDLSLRDSKNQNPPVDFNTEGQSLQILQEKAFVLFNQKDYKTSQKYFQAIIQQDESNVELLQKLSLCHFYLKEYEQGVFLMQKAISMQPQNLDSYYYYLGCAYCDQKLYMQGLIYLERAITQNQNHVEALFMLGNAYQNISCFSIAIIYYKKAVEINPQLEKAYFQIGETYFKMQNYQEALKGYQQACKLNSENHFFFVRLGNTQWKLQNLEDAIRSFEKATFLNKKFSKIGSIFQKFKDELVSKNLLEKCIEYYLKMFSLNPSLADSYYALGKIALQEKISKSAKEFFEAAIAIDKNHFEGLKALGHVCISLKEFSISSKALESALKIQAQDVDIMYDLGCCLFEQGKIQEATDQFRKAFRLNTISYEDIDDNMVKMGIRLLNSKENSKFSIEYFIFALQVNSNNAEAYFQKGKIYEGAYDIARAKEYYEKALQLSPLDKNYIQKVELFRELERKERDSKEVRVVNFKEILKEAQQKFNDKGYQKCIDLLVKVPSVSEDFPKVNELIGYAYEQIGEYENAAKCYYKASEQNPEDQTIIFNLGNCLFRIEKYDEAIEKYNIVLSINPNKASAFENLGACYFEKKQYDQAVFYYKKALEYNENDPITNYGLGKSYFSNNQFEQALKCFQKTLDSDQENPNYYLKMADTITMLKSDSLVGKIFKKNQHFTRDEKSRMYSLMAGVLYEMKEYQKSLEKCELAIDIDPHNFNAYLIKAASLKELSSFVQALNCFEEAIRINPNDPDCYYFYGQTLEVANLHMKALEKYDKSILLASQISKNEQNFQNLKQFQAAQKCLEIVSVRNPQFQNYFNEIGNNLFEKNDFYGAIECYKEELKYNQYDYAANYNMGQCYKNILKINEAIACFQRNIMNKHRESCLQMSKTSKIDYRFVEKLKLVSVSSMMDLQYLIRLELINKDGYDPNVQLEKQPLIRLVSQVQQIVSKKAVNYEDDIMKLGQLNRVDDVSKVYKILQLTGLEEQSIVVNVKPELMLILIGQQLIFFNNSVNLFYNPLKLFENMLVPTKTYLKDVESFQNLGNGTTATFKQSPIIPQQISFLKAIISQCLSKLKNSMRHISLCMNFKISSVYKIHFFQSIFRQKNFKPFLKIQKIENIFSNKSTNIQKINLKVENSNEDQNIALKTIKSKNFDEAVKEYTFQNCITHRNIHSSYFIYWNEDQNNSSMPQPLKERNLYTIDSLTYEEFLSVMLDCCEGLQQLTFYNIVHADIKPQNIFYDKKRAQIADFGSCIVSNTQNNEYTPTFCSPESESFESGQRITPSSDIFSLGKTFQYIAEKFKLPCSSSIQVMILLMMEQEPTRRIRVHDQIKIIQCEIFTEFLYQCIDNEMSLERFCEEISYIIQMRKKNYSMNEMMIDIKLNHEKVKELVNSNQLFIRSLFNQKYLYVFLVILSNNNISEQVLQVKQKIDKVKEDFEQEAVEIEQSAIQFLQQLQMLSPQEQYLEYLLQFNYEKFVQTITFFDNLNYEQAYLISIYLIWKTNLFNIEYPENINKELQEIDFMQLFKSFYHKDAVSCVNQIERQKQICNELIQDIFNTSEIQNQYKNKYQEILINEQSKLLEKLKNQQHNLLDNNIYSSDEEIELESITTLSAAISQYKDCSRLQGILSCDKVAEEEDDESIKDTTQKYFFQATFKLNENSDLQQSQSQKHISILEQDSQSQVQSLPSIHIEGIQNQSNLCQIEDKTVRKGDPSDIN